ncbi:hypothetical protein R1flu_012242 [Riccia fluitans]|uniref:C3H1-type domain-containing protein n=1 Tax=Riccia fluitans TaxID=41844 RepID=A0ABD1ZA12_9MARC
MEYYAQGQGAPSSFAGLEGSVSDPNTGAVLSTLAPSEEWHLRHGAPSPASPTADTGLEESVWQMTLQSAEGMEAPQGPYPERPGEPDCTYYMRTGVCGFGMSCRFNHPPNRKLAASVARNKGEYPERLGQPECQYYLKTGTCKFGATCKYHHPRDKAGSTGRVQLNFLGLPLRPGEKECAYYMRTGSCKYNVTCKFHHPQPTVGGLVPISGSSIYAAAAGPSSPAPQPYQGLPSWPIATRTPYIPSPRLQGPSSYAPMIPIGQGIVSVPGWNTYQGPVGPMAQPDGQQHPIGTGYVYTQQSDPASGGGVHGTFPQFMQASTAMGLPTLQSQQSLGSQKDNFPERPGQPECQYYMKTGDCKFGITCKYHHPKDRATPSPTCGLSPMGLPLRPGAQPCTFYTRYGICKFGPTCKFDHPLSGLPYSPSASSLTDMPVAPYPTLAPSEIQQDATQQVVSGSSNEASAAAITEEPPDHNDIKDGSTEAGAAQSNTGTTGPNSAQGGQTLSMISSRTILLYICFREGDSTTFHLRNLLLSPQLFVPPTPDGTAKRSEVSLLDSALVSTTGTWPEVLK